MSDATLGQRLVAECAGTFALVFAGCGAIMVDAKTDALGHVGVAISFGLVIAVMIAALGHVSGAHFNPAVTAGFALGRHFPVALVPAYWAAQIVGAVAAALLLRASLGDVGSLGRDDAKRQRRTGVRVGARADGLPDAGDPRRRHRHARGVGDRGHRDRRHGRARRDVRRADHRRQHEPCPHTRARGRGRPDRRTLDLPDGAIRGAAIAVVLYAYLARRPVSTAAANPDGFSAADEPAVANSARDGR